MRFLFAILIAGALFLWACNQNTDKTREQAAKATAQLRQEAKEAGAEIKQGTEVARKQGTAIAQGVQQGLQQGEKPVNVNSASRKELLTLPGINTGEADRIIAGRPYGAPGDLLSRKIVTPAEYERIRNKITAE